MVGAENLDLTMYDFIFSKCSCLLVTNLFSFYKDAVALIHKSLFVQCVSPTFTKIIEPLRCELSGEPVYDFYLDDTDAKIISPTIWGDRKRGSTH